MKIPVRTALYACIALIVLLLGSTIYLYATLRSAWDAQESRVQQQRSEPLIFPFFSIIPDDEFAHIQKYYRTEFNELKKIIESDPQLPPGANYSYYFENLNSGAHVGFDEKRPFSSGSLRKVPLTVAAFQARNEGWLDFDREIEILPEDINDLSGPIGAKGPGRRYTLRELIGYMLNESDNTAAVAIYRRIGTENYVNAMLSVGLTFKTLRINSNNSAYPLSAKEFSNVFRSLYFSNSLPRHDSNEILRMLTNTVFTEGLPKGVPDQIKVAHKIGYWMEDEQHHDCGIVYFPESPYILCVMTKGMSQNESDKFIAGVSKKAYDFMAQTYTTS